MKAQFIIVIFVLFAFCTSPKRKLYDDLSKIQGRDIVLLDSLRVFQKGTFKEYFKDFFDRSKPSFIVKIDGECVSCIENLYEWNDFIKENNCIQFVFIISASNYSDFQFYSELSNFEYPVVYDPLNTYSKNNNINQKTDILLLDKNQKVIIYGSPFLNQKMRNGYHKYIHALCN